MRLLLFNNRRVDARNSRGLLYDLRGFQIVPGERYGMTAAPLEGRIRKAGVGGSNTLLRLSMIQDAS